MFEFFVMNFYLKKSMNKKLVHPKIFKLRVFRAEDLTGQRITPPPLRFSTTNSDFYK